MFCLNAIEFFGKQLGIPFKTLAISLFTVHIILFIGVLVCLFLLCKIGKAESEKPTRSFFDPPANKSESACADSANTGKEKPKT